MSEVDLAPLMEPTRHKRLYLEACLSEIDDLRVDVTDYASQLDAHMAALDSDIRTHLWVTEDFVGPASSSLEQTRHEVKTLLARVDKVRKGFELLPQEDGPQSARKPKTRKK